MRAQTCLVLLLFAWALVAQAEDIGLEVSSSDLLAFINAEGHQKRNQQLLDSLYKLRISPGGADQPPARSSDSRIWVFRSTSGQLYECVEHAPPSQAGASVEAKPVEKSEVQEAEAAKRPPFSLDALNGRLELLRGTCVPHDGGWWTTRWCHATEVRQTHYEGAREVTSYSLGVFTEGKVKFAASPQESTDSGASIPASSSSEESIGHPLFYYQKFERGQMCDETGEPRRTEVRIYCCPRDQNVALVSLQETTLCHYTMTLCWSRLCEAGLPPLSANSRDTWAAVRPLTGLCLRYKSEAGWTHEVCFEKSARVFRQVAAKDLPGAHRKKQASSNQHRVLELDAKHMGEFSPLKTFKDTDEDGNKVQTEHAPDERVVRQVYDDGDICDASTGETYESHVKLACFLTKTAAPEIVSVRWVSKCQTLVLLHAPGLCDADEEKHLKMRSRARQNKKSLGYIVEDDGDEREAPDHGVTCTLQQ